MSDSDDLDSDRTIPRTNESGKSRLKREIARTSYRILKWGNDRVPTGLRSLCGFGLMVGGIFGFLPILGFWMFPLGVALVLLDIPFTKDKILKKIEGLSEQWSEADEAKRG